MTRLFINSSLLSILGECNIYYINHKYILLYLGLENTTLNKQKFISNKKNHTLIFFSGNNGNSGNNPIKALKLQQSFVTTFGVFCYHCYHFPFCPKSSKHCFLRIFSPNLDWNVISCTNHRWTLNFNFWLVFSEHKKPPGNSLKVIEKGLLMIKLLIQKIKGEEE